MNNDQKNIIYESLKKARIQRFLTNCYTLDVVNKSRKLWADGDDFVFSYDDHGIDRLIYAVHDYQSLDKLFRLVDGGRYCLEFMTKDPDEYVPSDSLLIARMMRMANPDCRTIFDSDSEILIYKDKQIGVLAEVQDVYAINQILWDKFHTEVSHLLSDEELEEIIKLGQIMIHKDQTGQIDAILQAEIKPKKFYINQVVNKSSKNVIHAILLNRLEDYVKAGGKYLFAWVEESNIASLKFHKKYGMSHDGMWNMVYGLER